MDHFDLFRFFRFWLGWVVAVYASIVTAQSLWQTWQSLTGRDRYMTMLRQYLLVHGLRLRFRAFWGDVLICVLLGVAFVLLVHAQTMMDRIEEAMPAQSVPQ